MVDRLSIAALMMIASFAIASGCAAMTGHAGHTGHSAAAKEHGTSQASQAMGAQGASHDHAGAECLQHRRDISTLCKQLCDAIADGLNAVVQSGPTERFVGHPAGNTWTIAAIAVDHAARMRVAMRFWQNQTRTLPGVGILSATQRLRL